MTRLDDRRRRGSLLLDAAMATVLLTIAMSVALQLITHLGRQRRAADLRQYATQTASNIMERVSQHPWESLEPGPPRQIELPAEALELLRNARCEVTVRSANDEDTLRTIVVELRWGGGGMPREASVRLIAWVAQAGKGRP